MAIPAQGLTFKFGTEYLQEVQDLEVDAVIRDIEGRNGWWGPRSSGTLRLRGFSIAGLQQDQIGNWRKMTITVRTSPTTVLKLWEGWARYDESIVSATRNGAVLFAFRFTLWAASNSSGTEVAG